MPSQWEREFEAENKRRAAAIKAAERIMVEGTKEPTNDKHELVWITPKLAVCPDPGCFRVYQKSGKVLRLHPHIGIAEDFKRMGIFMKAAFTLSEIRVRRAAAEAEKEAKRVVSKKPIHRPKYDGGLA